MSLLVKKDKPAHPAQINFFGADRVVFGAQEVPNLVEELRLAGRRHFCDISSHVVGWYVPPEVEFAARKSGSISVCCKAPEGKLYF